MKWAVFSTVAGRFIETDLTRPVVMSAREAAASVVLALQAPDDCQIEWALPVSYDSQGKPTSYLVVAGNVSRAA